MGADAAMPIADAASARGRGYGYRGRGIYVAPRAYYGPRCFYNRWGALVCRY